MQEASIYPRSRQESTTHEKRMTVIGAQEGQIDYKIPHQIEENRGDALLRKEGSNERVRCM